jgi:hypothetical protein
MPPLPVVLPPAAAWLALVPAALRLPLVSSEPFVGPSPASFGDDEQAARTVIETTRMFRMCSSEFGCYRQPFAANRT